MTRMKIAIALAAALIVTGCTAAAEDTTAKATAPTFGPGWRHEQMMQARGQGQMPPAMITNGGPGAGYRMGMMAGRGGPPLKADGTIDTTQLPEWCPLKTPRQPQ